jgi:trk system potassium uptake protein TrkA
MKELYGVIGLGRFGSSVALRLLELGRDVICIDKDENRVKELSETIENIYQADSLDERALKEIGITDCNVVVVSIGEDIETSVMLVAILHSLGVENIYAKAVSALHGRILAKVGAKKVIFPEKDMGVNLANSLAGVDIIQTLSKGRSYVLAKIKAPKMFFGKSLLELDIRRKYGLNIIGIERGDDFNVNPLPDETILDGDLLMVVGKKSDIERVS